MAQGGSRPLALECCPRMQHEHGGLDVRGVRSSAGGIISSALETFFFISLEKFTVAVEHGRGNVE